MSYVIYSIIQILNFIVAHFNKESKLIGFLTLLFIWMLLAGNTSNLDMGNYINYYNNSVTTKYNETIEVGYLFLQKVGNALGLDYTRFKLFSIIPCLILIHSTIKKFSTNYHYVYFFYMLYVMFMDAVQIRNFMAISIVIYSIRFLMEFGKKNVLKYVISILIATSIHTSSFIYILLIFINGRMKKTLIKIVVGATFVLCIITFLNDNQIPLINNILQVIDYEKVNVYLSTSTRFGFLYPFFLHILNFIVILWARNIMKNFILKHNKLNGNIKYMNFINLVFWINFLAFMFFPLYMMNLNFYRLTRNFIIINLIACSLVQHPLRRNLLKLIVFNFFVLFNTGVWFWFDIIMKDHVEDIVKVLFEYNLFFN